MSERDLTIEHLPPETLKRHPLNYREHPEDQLDHLAQSLKTHGCYRNVVVAEDNTILAGHGVVLAAKRLGLESIAVVRLPLAADAPAALKVLIGDNEIEHLAEQNDRLLADLLKEVNERDPLGLLGTGYDEMMLANLAFVTRPAAEIADMDEAAHWAGMPEYSTEAGREARLRCIVSFASEEDRAAFFEQLGLPESTAKTSSIWWPQRPEDDVDSLRFEASEA